MQRGQGVQRGIRECKEGRGVRVMPQRGDGGLKRGKSV